MSQIVPKLDYSKSLIYKIVCKDTNIKNVYIGSTTNFKNRKSRHKSNCYNENNKQYNINLYKFIRENGGFENWSMILIDNTPCNSKLELLKFEREHIEKIDNELLLNQIIPSRTKEEYRKLERNKAHRKEYDRKRNKEKRDYILQQKHKYYKTNEEYFKEKVKCDICNSVVSRYYLTNHKKTIKCLKNVKCFIQDD